MKAAYRADSRAALAIFARSPVIHVAGCDADGVPILRTVNAVVVDGKLAFHGGDHGDKMAMVGRRVVATADDIVASIPSYFIDPEKACPASTYYRSAMVHGRLVRIDDRERKARVLWALMARFQPEGGYAPIDASDPLYSKAIDKLLCVEIMPEVMAAKHKLGQNRSGAVIASVLTGLWRRGRAGDMRAIRLVREAHRERPLPEFLRGPGGVEMCVFPDESDAARAADLLASEYWNEGCDRDTLVRAQSGSSAWVVARRDGRLVGTARANSDGAKHAMILDVAVVAELRGRGVGAALMRLLLDHPAVRNCRIVRLNTRDAQGFYARFGFGDRRSPYPVMTLDRPAPAAAATAAG